MFICAPHLHYQAVVPPPQPAQTVRHDRGAGSWFMQKRQTSIRQNHARIMLQCLSTNPTHYRTPLANRPASVKLQTATKKTAALSADHCNPWGGPTNAIRTAHLTTPESPTAIGPTHASAITQKQRQPYRQAQPALLAHTTITATTASHRGLDPTDTTATSASLQLLPSLHPAAAQLPCSRRGRLRPQLGQQHRLSVRIQVRALRPVARRPAPPVFPREVPRKPGLLRLRGGQDQHGGAHVHEDVCWCEYSVVRVMRVKGQQEWRGWSQLCTGRSSTGVYACRA